MRRNTLRRSRARPRKRICGPGRRGLDAGRTARPAAAMRGQGTMRGPGNLGRISSVPRPTDVSLEPRHRGVCTLQPQRQRARLLRALQPPPARRHFLAVPLLELEHLRARHPRSPCASGPPSPAPSQGRGEVDRHKDQSTTCRLRVAESAAWATMPRMQDAGRICFMAAPVRVHPLCSRQTGPSTGHRPIAWSDRPGPEAPDPA